MNDDLKKKLMLAGAVLLLLLAAIVGYRTATQPGETINDYSKIPPKGAGKFDTDRPQRAEDGKM